MIGQVRGTVVARDADTVLVDVGGVGYEIVATRGAHARAVTGEEVVLATHLHVREDVWQLFGFASREERELFRQLLGVNGVGPKLALAIVSQIAAPDLVRAIAAQDVKLLASVSGVGQKTAQRICVDLRDRVGPPVAPGAAPAAVGGVPTGPGLDDPFYAAREALVALGYAVADAEAALRGSTGPVEERVRHGLGQLARSGARV